MKTFIYFVRHAESPFIEGMERTRGLSNKGKLDAIKVDEKLKAEEIDVFISSPYERAIQTIKVVAAANEIVLFEDLRERAIGQIKDVNFKEAKLKVYADKHFSFQNGESTFAAQTRAVSVIDTILQIYKGKKIVIGTHGDIMTLMMNHFDDRYDFEFWESTSMPDIYRCEFEAEKLIEVVRLWK